MSNPPRYTLSYATYANEVVLTTQSASYAAAGLAARLSARAYAYAFPTALPTQLLVCARTPPVWRNPRLWTFWAPIQPVYMAAYPPASAGFVLGTKATGFVYLHDTRPPAHLTTLAGATLLPVKHRATRFVWERHV